ncbi:MAG TPA: 4Fe-4S binding protein [Methanoregulaceae archaeon]|jgi:4Fe-4S ferredoxin|nr:4Fe-4S binding protein [Burkholderiaceae bacterium]NLH25385.1 4Fe-4S binding protein [Methanomicrobiales archaeon]HNJ81677.1 4Fe-4S binding protein [Methanoregulaceae archaeon]HPS22575.1 4Fe-4S binding protein [Methanoregulaceae archaeon]
MTLFPKFSKKRDGVNVIQEQKLLQQVNHLILNSEVCTGCGICVEACPEEAIVLGLVGATRRGAVSYAAPVDIDEAKCSYCGVCVVMCPFNALTLKIDGEERLPIVEKEGFPTYDMVADIDDEKCVRCTICEEVCPRDAIDRDVTEFEGTRTDGKERQLAIKTKTTFKVDDEKCTLCGICGALCPAITVKHKPFTAESGKVEGEVVWDETKCDACKVCVEACPEECITVEREVESDKLEGQVDIDQKMCCTCTWCSRSCPTEAITVEKLFEGDIEFAPEKCPGGCSTCVEVCPANAIYLPSSVPASQMKGKVEPTIAVNKDFCILCGACVNACPGEDIIRLHRTGIRVKGKETDLFNKIKEKLCTPRTSKVKEETPGSVQLKMMEKA